MPWTIALDIANVRPTVPITYHLTGYDHLINRGNLDKEEYSSAKYILPILIKSNKNL